MLAAIGARVIDRELPVGLAEDAFTETGALEDADVAFALADPLAELLGALRPVAAPA